MSNLYPLQPVGYSAPSTEKPAASRHRAVPHTIRGLRRSSLASTTPRTLLVCLDGTGDKFDHDNSNVVQFVSCLVKHEPGRQISYYQPGIGTYDRGGLTNGIRAAMDMAVGSGLGEHIKDAYRFLMRNYRQGDKICLLGFSRGAYTARCLVGMLHKVGLLAADNLSQVNFAYQFYKDDSEDGYAMSAQFKKTFCTDVSVYFVGLWDCVASVGFVPRKLPFTKSPTNSISYFRHAMSLDEHRSKFKILQWQQDACVKAPSSRTPSAVDSQRSDSKVSASYDFDLDEKLAHKPVTDVLEVWFMGAHADVGGGAVQNETRHMLSRIPLRWMVRQCFECNTGILFDSKSLAEHGLDLHTLYPDYQPRVRPLTGPAPTLLEAYHAKTIPGLDLVANTFSYFDHSRDRERAKPHIRPGTHPATGHLALMSEASEDYFDAHAPINDELAKSRGWWILELWPIKVHMILSDGETWEKRVRWNLGRRRACRQPQPKMHWTVRDLADERRYRVRVRTARDCAWEVVA